MTCPPEVPRAERPPTNGPQEVVSTTVGLAALINGVVGLDATAAFRNGRRRRDPPPDPQAPHLKRWPQYSQKIDGNKGENCRCCSDDYRPQSDGENPIPTAKLSLRHCGRKRRK